MIITANNPKRKSWLEVAKESDFPIQNIPFGVFITKDDIITIGSRIGDYAIDLGALHQLGYFEFVGSPLKIDMENYCSPKYLLLFQQHQSLLRVVLFYKSQQQPVDFLNRVLYWFCLTNSYTLCCIVLSKQQNLPFLCDPRCIF